MNTRALEALAARQRGDKLITIAKRYGVTKERARQLVVLGERIELERSSTDPWYQLSIRTRNALINDGCEPTLDGVLDRYATVNYNWRETGTRALAHVQSIGKKSIADLQAWLVRHGKEPIP